MVSGSLQTKKLSDGKEYFYIVLNLYDSNHKRKPKWIPTGLETKGNRRKAMEMLVQAQIEYDTKEISVEADMLFSDYVDQWLAWVKTDIEQSTYEGYMCSVAKISSYFREKGLKIKDIRVQDIEEFYTYMLTQEKISQKDGSKSGLSIRTVRGYKFIINAVLNKAVVNGLIKINPALNIKVTNKTKKQLARDINFFTTSEANDFMKYLIVINDPLADLVIATLYFGFRRSEVLGLTEHSIDFTKHTLTVKRTIVKVKTTQDKNKTKTLDSKRTYSLTVEMEVFLKGVLQKKKEYKKYYGSSYIENDFVFTWENGKPFAPDFIYHHFVRVVKKYGRPEFTFHDLRHSTASILYEQGWQPKDIQEWLGHADFYTTMNIYTHIAKCHRENQANQLTGVFTALDISKKDVC